MAVRPAALTTRPHGAGRASRSTGATGEARRRWCGRGNRRPPFVLDAWMVVVAFLFSGAIGVIFGYFPARKAARLDPIDALRHK